MIGSIHFDSLNCRLISIKLSLVLTDTCTYKRLFLYFIKECNDFYSIAEQDQDSFLPGWKPKLHDNASSTPTPTTTVEPTEKGPWDFQTGEELKTYPYWGYKATYSAGGNFVDLAALS